MTWRFSGPACWSVLLICLACNARGETPSPAGHRQEPAAAPSGQTNGGNKPVVIDAERIHGRHEYEPEPESGVELRTSTNPVTSTERSVSKRMKAQSIPPATKDEAAMQAPEPAAGGILPLPGHAVEQGEARLRDSSRARPSRIPASSAPARAGAPDGSSPELKPGVAEVERIPGHGEQEGDMKLRLAGEAEPDMGTQPGSEMESEKPRPVFIAAERLQGHAEQEVEAIGKAELSSGDQFISADRMKYYQETDEAEAEGRVRVEQQGDILEGSNLRLNLVSKTGQLSDPNYRLKNASSRGYAGTLLFEGENQYRLKDATYTTCPAGDDDWLLHVSDLKLDHDKREGTARNVKISFKDVPILYTPWMNFSYSGQRKSGLLAPTYGTSVRTGIEVTLPFYWNIAPNYDATFSARMMSKRGVAFNNEFRYLTEKSNGTLLADILPNDWDREETRWRTSFAHNQYLGYGFSTRLDYNRVSDDAYFRDLGNSLNLTSRTNLLQQGLVSYNRALGTDGIFNVNTLVQSFQTIQDPLASIVVPYRRLPQVSVLANKPDVFGLDLNFAGSWSNFSHPTQVNGHRAVFFPSVSYPLRSAFGYITPKVGIHHTRYDLDGTSPSLDENPTRTLPIISLDSGVAFDREIEFRGERFNQTLEPRIFYVYVPFRDQSRMPNFDSGKMDFSFAQILTENRFSGSDRINDANQVTFALTSRLINPATGQERLRLAVGHQLSFIDRRINLDTPQTINRRPDFIAAVTGFITPTITTDTSLQFDQTRLVADVVRSGLSYRPEPGRVVNLGYRFTRDVLHQVDASSQWRWSEKWQTVARLNYSLQDERILEGLAGVEYNACCWSLRFVLQHLITATQRSTTAAFLQLELSGLMQIGSNPLQVLQRSIPGYTRIGSQGGGLIEGP